MGWGSITRSVRGAVSSAARTVARPVQRVVRAAPSVVSKSREFVNSPTGSMLLPAAAMLTPTGRANLAGALSSAAPIAGGFMGGPAGAAVADVAATAGGGIASDWGILDLGSGSGPGIFGGGGGGNQEGYAARMLPAEAPMYGGGGGFSAPSPYAGGAAAGTPWGIIAAVGAGLAVLVALFFAFKRKG